MVSNRGASAASSGPKEPPASVIQSINPTNNSLNWNTGVIQGTAHHRHDKSLCSDWGSRYELRKVFPLQGGLGLGPAPAHLHIQCRTCVGNICSHSFHLWDTGSTQWDVTSILRPASQSCNALAPGPNREVQGGNWQLFSSQRLCKIGVKATARKQKIKQALQHTSHRFPRSVARHSTGIRLMQLKSSLLIKMTVTKMGRSLDIMAGPDAQSLTAQKPV